MAGRRGRVAQQPETSVTELCAAAASMKTTGQRNVDPTAYLLELKELSILFPSEKSRLWIMLKTLDTSLKETFDRLKFTTLEKAMAWLRELYEGKEKRHYTQPLADMLATRQKVDETVAEYIFRIQKIFEERYQDAGIHGILIDIIIPRFREPIRQLVANKTQPTTMQELMEAAEKYEKQGRTRIVPDPETDTATQGQQVQRPKIKPLAEEVEEEVVYLPRRQPNTPKSTPQHTPRFTNPGDAVHYRNTPNQQQGAGNYPGQLAIQDMTTASLTPVNLSVPPPPFVSNVDGRYAPYSVTPRRRAMTGNCFNCGGAGHRRANCTRPSTKN